MPHATEDDPGSQEENDFNSILNDLNSGILQGFNGEQFDFSAAGEGGEKADDAQDFEDIGDDDLADEDDGMPPINSAADTSTLEDTQISTQNQNDVFEDDGLDDLFGDKELGSPPASPRTQSHERQHDRSLSHRDRAASFGSAIGNDQILSRDQNIANNEDIETNEELSEQYRQQTELFAQARRAHEERIRAEEAADNLPAPPADSELFSIIWPQFEAEKPPRFGLLFPGKRAQYLGKTPLKAPKAVQPSKVNLDIDQDQERDFRLPGSAAHSFPQRVAKSKTKGVILTADSEPQPESSDEDLESLPSEDLDDVAGYKWQDLVAVCQEWNIPGSPHSEPEAMDLLDADDDAAMGLEFDGLFHGPDYSSTRGTKRKSTHDQSLHVLHRLPNSFEDPEEETAHLAKRVRIDLNDPLLLVEPVTARERRINFNDVALEREKRSGSTQKLFKRYNISNDEAYDMLKENRQSKIRGTLGSQALEHAMPATRLQYPFYKIRLTAREARSFHRPNFVPDPGLVHFEKLRHVKRKHLKGLTPQTIFEKSEDLSQADNSNVLLLEYSEEYPVMMSNFGMGNRLVNYYRRKDENDTFRPKHDIGETEVLLAQDKSPFAIFGDVDPGETVPTISNVMYRAPIFQHQANQQDFLLISNRTGINGRKWFLKNMENLHVVGQEFPSVEVPGSTSRKVTDASKKRLRMLSYRLFRRHKKLKNDMIMKHIPGSDVAQNRSKMREFMNYDKDRGWLPRESEVPTEPNIRSWIRPEDVALLDAMQVGEQQLHDSGYNKPVEDVDDDDDEKQGTQSLDERLAPWATTKNFLYACQGKAMLALHGEGDPTGRGEAFNFVRTSMKGGFKEIGEPVDETIKQAQRKEFGGHSYNVAKQQKKYNDTIRRIWEAQSASLSSTVEHDVDMDDAEEAESYDRGRTPTSAAPLRYPRDDETGSIFSKTSTGSQGGRVLRIARKVPDRDGNMTETVEIIRDAKVIREYMRRRKQTEMENKRYVARCRGYMFSMLTNILAWPN